jgi:hypothetical protein
MGEPTAPPFTQHLKPVMQSSSTVQFAPVPPFPGTHEVDPVVSVPFW